MGTGPFKFVEHVQGLALSWARRTPTTGTRASPTSTASARCSSAVGARRSPRSAASAAHIQFRGFSPAERDSLVQALGNKVTVQESPWDCILMVRHQPREEALRRQARPPGAHARARPLRGLEGASQDRDRARTSPGCRCPGTPYATPPAELAKLAGYWPRHQRVARRGAAAAEGGRRREPVVHAHEPRHPDAVRAGRRLADRPVAPDRPERAPGGASRPRLLSRRSAAGDFEVAHGLPVRLHRRARPRQLTSSCRPTESGQLRPVQGPRARRRSTTSRRARADNEERKQLLRQFEKRAARRGGAHDPDLWWHRIIAAHQQGEGLARSRRATT